MKSSRHTLQGRVDVWLNDEHRHEGFQPGGLIGRLEPVVIVRSVLRRASGDIEGRDEEHEHRACPLKMVCQVRRSLPIISSSRASFQTSMVSASRMIMSAITTMAPWPRACGSWGGAGRSVERNIQTRQFVPKCHRLTRELLHDGEHKGF